MAGASLSGTGPADTVASGRRCSLPTLLALGTLVLAGCGGASAPSDRSPSPTASSPAASSAALAYPIVDTGQTRSYDASGEIPAPGPGQPFYGQDAQLAGTQPSYSLSSDGRTVFDNVTPARSSSSTPRRRATRSSSG